jgi:threonyl-tRNA synthetase
MLIVGPKEAQSDTVNVRIRGVAENKTMAVVDFLKIAKGKISDKETNVVNSNW